jgi:two-component system LytT family response regulator
VSDNRPIRILIVDDEEPARLLLSELLGRMPGVAVVAECADGFEALRAASELAPDVALLDISMPKLDGFEVAELLDPSITVVFVTAHDQHALKAFEVHAADYVLKPFRSERLEEAIRRARERVARGRPAPDPSRLAAAARPVGEWAERIVVREEAGVRILPIDTVDFIEARDDAVAVRSEGKTYGKPTTLTRVAETFDPTRFVRVHRSFLVNLDRIRKLESYAKNSRVAILADGTRVPISREGYARLKTQLRGDLE